MRITFVNTLYEPYVGGGAEITLHAIAKGMKARGHQCTVITTGPKGDVLIEDVDGVQVCRIPINNIYWHFSEQRESRYRRIRWHWQDRWNFAMRDLFEARLKDIPTDIVSFHNLTGFSSAVWDVPNKLGIPAIQVLHDYYSICAKSTMFRNMCSCAKQCASCRILRLRHPEASGRLDAVVGVSSAVLNNHLTRGYFGSVGIKRVINNSRIIPTPVARNNDAGNIKFGFIGTLSAPKGLEWLLEAFSLLKSRTTTNVELLIGGTGKSDYILSLKQRFADEGIRFLGKVVPKEFFSQVDISVVPSVWDDPFPGVVFESLGYGVPVIATKAGGIPEMVKDGENGCLITPDQNPESLCRAMQSIIDDPTKLYRWKENARDSVAKLLDPERQLAEYEELYDAVIKHHELKA